jgi:putative ABC transport system permease protein
VVRLRALDRKLLRELWRLRGQVLAIGGVIASGVAVLVMSLAALESLDETARAYYERERFAHVFAHVERAPLALVERMRALPGVQGVEARVVRVALLDVSGFAEPAVGELVSVPEVEGPALNRVTLRAGRMPGLGAPDEVVLSEPFAEAHRLALGSSLGAILNGRARRLHVVGIGLSPETVYTIGPGALMPDDRRFGVLWMGAEALRAAFDERGAFDDVSLLLMRGADEQLVIDAVDRMLAPYGGVGAIARADQRSNWFLMNELEQLRTLSRILPTIFLAVAAFLTHMVLGRLIAVERSEIGLLKAFGYRDRDVAWHYVKLALVICAVGVVLGWALGWALGLYNTRMYARFFRFPFLLYRPSAAPFAVAALASAGAAIAGALRAVRVAVALPPAEAMRPPLPTRFRRASGAAAWLAGSADGLTRIVLRQVARWPVRSALTSAAVALAIGLLGTALQWSDAIDAMSELVFEQGQRQDVTLAFAHTRPRDAVREAARLPGVILAEPVRVVPARLRLGWRVRREAVVGIPALPELQRVVAADGRAIALPPEGLVLSTALAERLEARLGDEVSVGVLEGARRVVRVPVVATFETYLGTPAYMQIDALDRLMRDPPTASAAQLAVDPRALGALLRSLRDVPAASSVSLRRAAIETLHATMGRNVLIFVSFFVAFACMLAFGVAYNAASVSLSERGRELATLRVLGFREAEISYVLLGEIALLTALALPLGCAAARGLTALIAKAFETDLFRIPLELEPPTYAWAMLVAVAATAVSALVVRARLRRLDLVAVLKSRE